MSQQTWRNTYQTCVRGPWEDGAGPLRDRILRQIGASNKISNMDGILQV